jgi:hypothetical protein
MTNLAGNIGILNTGMQANMEKMALLSKNIDSMMAKRAVSAEYCSEEEEDDMDRESGNEDNFSLLGDPEASSSRSDRSGEPPTKKAKFLSMMSAAALNREPKGNDIDEALAANITQFMRNKPMDDVKQKELYDSLPPPANCPGLEKIKVNPTIWTRINEGRSVDIKFQRIHIPMVKGVTAVAMLCNKLLNAWDASSSQVIIPEEEFGEMMELTTKAFKSFGASNFELTMKRREAMKPHMNSEYVHLCVPSVPYTDQLYGDDVTKTIKDISDNNRVCKKVFPTGGRMKKKSSSRDFASAPRSQGRDSDYSRRQTYRNDRHFSQQGFPKGSRYPKQGDGNANNYKRR